MKYPHRLVVAGAALAALTFLTACEQTTVVDVSTVPTTVVNATTTLPAGSAAELVAELRDRAYSLGSAIADSGAKGRAVLAELETLWTAAKAQLPRTEFVEEVGHQIELMQIAVKQTRPADAEKAALRTQALIDNQLETWGTSGAPAASS